MKAAADARAAQPSSGLSLSYGPERDAAVRAAQQAARLIRERAGEVDDRDADTKGVHDFVTEIDEAAQALIIRVVRQAFPEIDVLAEEGADEDALAPSEGPRWIIDPIDGTTNFMHGLPPYAVSIALEVEQESVVGVVLDVARGELFTAVRGGGLYVSGAPAQVSSTRDLDDALLATGFPYRAFDHVDAYLKVLGRFMRTARGIRRGGSASVDLAHVACGRYSGFFETGLRPWDVAAGVLLVEEAGGRVTDYRGERCAVFGQQILATNGRIHEAMQEVLAPMQDVRG